MFTLKVIATADGGLKADDRHHMGGIDITQIRAFMHVADGLQFVDFMHSDDVISLAEAHGWRIEMTQDLSHKPAH